MIGQTISHYRVVELLGAGGMGEVYRAEDLRLRRAVALKVLPLALVQDREAKERLMLEAQAASSLDHPNICTIHEVDETPDGRVFLAMAYYDGETLRARLTRGPLALDAALGVAAQVARALVAAHAAGIVHRDIKPANIILTSRGEVKLLDFGIAKVAEQTALTRTGTTLGTLAYMAPELFVNQPADVRSDIWALGVVLYEMIAGRPPFTGDHDVAVMRAIADGQAPSLRPETPAAVQAIVDKALRPEPSDRYASAQAFLDDVEAVRARTATARIMPPDAIESPRASRRGIVAAVAGAVLVLAAALVWFAVHNARLKSARQRLPELAKLIETEQFALAYRLMRQVEPYLTDDPAFEKLRSGFLYPLSVRTVPEGADVYMKPYGEPDGPWDHLGRSPIDAKGPLGYSRWRVVKAGYTTFEGADGSSSLLGELKFTLDVDGALPPGMVRVPGGNVALEAGTIRLDDFFMDKFEVTNRDFKKFVDAGGYRNRQYWREPFESNGRTLSWDEAMAQFRDATGRPGPAAWELGTYPEGQDAVPVHGISWFEANAYARFAGKMIPTIHHWRKAAAVGIYSDILQFSNFSGKGPARAGEYAGIGPFGTYDMAGNVKEWCWNAVGSKRYTLGGGYDEPVYQFRGTDARDPFDRSANQGFRTIKPATAAAIPDAALRPLERTARDYSRETPASDGEWQVYRRLYDYDRGDLHAAVESTDESSMAWRVERVSYAAAYGSERVTAYLFLPKQGAPPYQTVVYFPHSGGFSLRSFQQAEMTYLGFIVKAGRALLFPMYKGMYERRLATPLTGPNAQRDQIVEMIKDLQRSVDFLQTRAEIDHDRIGFFGVSYGAAIAPIALTVERRIKAAVIWSGGFRGTPTLAEVDPFNFAPHVRTPLLMLNGRDDFTFPVEESQKPMFRMIGTPDADKRHVIYPGGHVFPFARVEKDTLDWFDHYLGAVR